MLTRIKRLLFSPTGIYLGAAVLSRAGGLFLIPLYTRRLQPTDFGTLALANTLTGLLPILFSLGLTAGLSRVFFDRPANEDGRIRFGAVARLLVNIALATGLSSTLIVWLAWPSATPSFTRWQLMLTSLASVGAACATVTDTWLRVNRRPAAVATLSLGTFVMLVGGALYLVLVRERGLDGVIEAQCIVACTTGAIGVMVAWFGLRTPDPLPEGFRRATSLGFSLPFIPHFLANWAFGAGDRWVLASVGDQAMLGHYGIGQQLAAPVAMTASAINESQAPLQGAAFQSGGAASLRAAITADLKLTLKLTCLPWLALLLGLPILKLVLGPAYVQGLYLLPFIGLAGLIEGAYYPPINALLYLGRTTAIPMITAASAATSIALTAVLTLWLGLSGLIIARLLATTFRSGLCWWIALKALNGGTQSP